MLVVVVLLSMTLYLGVAPVQALDSSMTIGVTSCTEGTTTLTAGPAGNYHVTLRAYLNGTLIDNFTSGLSGIYGPGETQFTFWTFGIVGEGDSGRMEYEAKGPSTHLLAAVSWDCVGGQPVNIQASVTDLSGDGQVLPPPGIWLSDVCEPFDGFSGDGWTTLGSDAASKPYGSALFVAASMDGPWHSTEFNQPPYIISESQMDALAALVGAPTRYDLWMKASEVGTPANYGSMVEDRAAIIDDLCGVE